MTSPVSVGDQPVTRQPVPDSAPQPAARARDRQSAAASASAEPAVQLFDVTKRFGDVVAVDRMNLRIADGAFYSFLGPSGCGKTTTLRMIAGFEQPNEGRILLEGRPVQGVPPYRRNVNTVFQHYALFPHMSVAQNVGYGLRQRGAGKQDEMRRVGEMLDLVQLRGYERRRTWELSGGQQQRVALARALINRPAVLLLDEPLGALDRKLRHEMQIELKQIQHEVGITFVYVTHDQEEALTMSDTIVVMRDGRIQQEGAPQTLYLRPANRFVAGFIGSSNFIEAAVLDAQSGSDRARVRTERGLTLDGRRTDPDAAATSGDAVTVAIRPESILVGPRGEPPGAGAGWFATAGRVGQGTYLGDQTEYRINIPELGELIVRRQHQAGAQTQRTFGPGEDVSVAWHESSALVLMS